MSKIAAGLLICIGAISACASVFFCYYTLRLLFLSTTGMIDAAHRTTGLSIGAGVFPVASFSFGWLSLTCVRSATRRLSRQ